MELEEFEEIYEQAYNLFKDYERKRGAIFTNTGSVMDYMDYWVAVATKQKYSVDKE